MPPSDGTNARSAWTKHLSIFGAFALFFVVYFSPVLMTGSLLAPEDGRIQNLPAFLGERSLWSAKLYSGWPQVADPLVQTFYFVSCICKLIPLPIGWNLFVILGYVFCAFFMYLFVFHITRNRFASVMSGLMFTMSGFMIFEIRHTHLVHATVFLPITLLIIEKLWTRFSVKWFALGALAIGTAMLNGHAQTLAYVLGVLAVYTVMRAAQRNAKKLHFCFTILGFVIAGLLVGAIQIFPTYELLKFSARAKFSYQDFLTFSLAPLQVVGLICPYILGTNFGSYFGVPNFSPRLSYLPTAITYLGILPLVLLWQSLLMVRRLKGIRQYQTIFWLVIGFLAFFVSFGGVTPLAQLLYHIPPFGQFRAHYRLYDLVAFSLAVVCGITLDALGTDKKFVGGKAIVVAITVLALIFGLALFAEHEVLRLVFQNLPDVVASAEAKTVSQNPAILVAAVFIATTLGAFAFWLKKPTLHLSRAVLLTILLADLGTAAWFSDWRVFPGNMNIIQPPPTAEVAQKIIGDSHQRVLSVRGGNGLPEELPPNISRLWNVENASGYSPLMFTRYGELLDITEGGFIMVPWTFKSENRGYDIVAIRLLTTNRNDDRLAKFIADGKSVFKKVGVFGECAMYENTRALPRYWLVNETISLQPDEVLSTIRGGKLPDGRDFDPVRMALLETGTSAIDTAPAQVVSSQKLDSKPDLPPATMSTAANSTAPANSNSANAMGTSDPGDAISIEHFANEDITLDVYAKADKFLVLSEMYYPGWSATVDGAGVKVMRTDYVLRGFPISAGKHKIRLRYEPGMFRTGMCITLVTLGLLAIAVLLDRRSARKAL